MKREAILSVAICVLAVLCAAGGPAHAGELYAGTSFMGKVHVYDGQDHAFARVGGAHYDQAAAELANGRSLAHLREALAA